MNAPSKNTDEPSSPADKEPLDPHSGHGSESALTRLRNEERAKAQNKPQDSGRPQASG